MTVIDEVIKDFVKDRVGGVIVNDAQGSVCYQDARIRLSFKGMESWQRKRPELDERKTWEFTDAETGQYYRVETAMIEKDGGCYQCHLFTDVSDYASLFQDISDYSKKISDMSDFQKSILGKLSQDYDSFLPELTEFCRATDSILYMWQEGADSIRKSSYGRRLHRVRIPVSAETEKLFSAERFGLSDGYYCFLSEQTEDERYALFLRRGRDFDEEYFRDASVYNVIRLYIENGILREKIVYESEHDGLTGLYNKTKYLSMKEEDFGHPGSVAILYFDVNNLKQVNDTKGHEAGDRLIVRASRSIRSIEDEQIYAFRMGGDEFMVVAVNVSEKDVERLQETWAKALESVNREDSSEPVTVACGVSYADSAYDLDQVIAEADNRMYENKREMKAERA